MSHARRESAQDEWRLLVQEAIDLLTERKYGNPARSPGHNARLMLQDALAAAPTPPAAEAPGQEPVAVSSHDLIKRLGGDPDTPFEVGAFPPEMREASPYLAPPTYADGEAKGGGRAFFDGLTKGFITLTSGDGNPYIKISYRTLQDAQDAHGLLIAAIRSLASPAPKGET